MVVHIGVVSLFYFQAKMMAVHQHKWLLVNIQDSVEFGAHQLNRDTWSNKDVKSLITSSFIFWQVSHTFLNIYNQPNQSLNETLFVAIP